MNGYAAANLDAIVHVAALCLALGIRVS